MNDLAVFLEATVRAATPLAFAALGETIAERAGIINIGLEGIIVGGCLGAAILGASHGLWPGVGGGMAVGVVLAAVFAVFAVSLRADQIICGTALTLGAYGLTGMLSRVVFGDAGLGLTLPTMGPIAVPGLVAIPIFGPALFDQPPLTYLLYACIAAVAWALYRTHVGLALRAVGEHPAAAMAAGISPQRSRWGALLAGGALGGLGGSSLVLAQTGTFTEQMSAGRGFIAIGIVALGRWHPVGAALGALLFGAASALQVHLQASGSALPYQLFLAFPYVLTLVVLVAGYGRRRAPAMLGRNVADADQVT
jgi:simple sugar transport system permease protein